MVWVGVVGSRVGVSPTTVWCELDNLLDTGFLNVNDTFVSGGASGVDSEVKKWAKVRNLTFVECLPEGFSKDAFLKRNRELVSQVDMLVAFKSKSSKTHGTDYTVARAKEKNIPVLVLEVD